MGDTNYKGKIDSIIEILKRFEMVNQSSSQLKEALSIIGELKASNEFYADPESWMIKDKHSWRKSSPRSHGDDELIRNYHHPLRDWIGSITAGGKLARKTKQSTDQRISKLREVSDATV